MRFVITAALSASFIAAALAVEPRRLEYEGISAATNLADLKTRFPGKVDMVSDEPSDLKQPIAATIRFDPWLGRAHFLDYYEITNAQRVIRLFFVKPGTRHPQNDEPLACNVLQRELEARYGKSPKVEEGNEEALHHIKRIWTEANETMTLDCARLLREPLTVDRLLFECHGACRR